MTALIERIRRRCIVCEETGCWRWLQGVSGTGYPVMRLNALSKSPLLVRRVAYVAEVASIGPNQVITDTCGDIRCVNPAHLRCEARSKVIADNNVRLALSGRIGGRKPWKMTHVIAADARRRHAAGERAVALAAEYGVAVSTLKRALAGKTYPESCHATWVVPLAPRVQRAA